MASKRPRDSRRDHETDPRHNRGHSGQITFSGATGSITLADTGTVCGNTASPWLYPATIASTWEITGGTGQFSGITGSGTSQGTIGGNGPVVHFTGTVSY